jgi:hypothetical protein
MSVDINDVIKMYSKLLNHLQGHIKEGNFDHLDIVQSKELKQKIKELKKILKASNKTL